MEITVESVDNKGPIVVPVMGIPRKFNETLTDWAIRCQVLRRYQAVKEEPHAEPVS